MVLRYEIFYFKGKGFLTWLTCLLLFLCPLYSYVDGEVTLDYEESLAINWFGRSEQIYWIEYKTSLLAEQWSYADTYYVGANEAYLIDIDRILPSPSSMAFFRLQMESVRDYSDADADDLPDWWEQFQPDALTVYPYAFETTLIGEEEETLPIYLKAPADSVAEFTVVLSNNEVAGQFVYSYTDNLTGGAIYNWTEISETGTRLHEISDNGFYYEKVNLSNFSFPFYENTYDELYVWRDGFVCFTDPSGTYYYNNYIAAFSESFDPAQSGSIYYKEAADHLIIQYQSVVPYSITGEGDAFTFQMVLHADGEIDLFYKEMLGNASSALIGIKNADSTDSLELFYGNQSHIEAGLAYRISSGPAKFVDVTPITGIVPAGSIEPVSYTHLTLPTTPYV